MKYSKNLLLLIFTLLLVSAGCKKEDDNPVATTPTVDESAVLVQYLEANGDYLNTSAPSLVAASAVYTSMSSGTQYIIDIRDTTAFKAGHISGAKNVLFKDLLTHVKTVPTTYTSIVIACYSGQTASYAATLLRLAGYSNVSALKWGMSSWDSVFATGKWLGNMKNDRASQFVTDSVPKAAAGNLPKINTGKTTGKEILEARVQLLLDEGFTCTMTSATLFTGLTSNYIINYWPAAQYKDPGHVPGAIQYTPKVDLKSTTFLKTIPTDKPVVVYCYTGQTSAAVAAFLKVLGYDAKTLLYGCNAMIYDQMVVKGMSVFKSSEIMKYPYVVGN